jgi:hypothetical protein
VFFLPRLAESAVVIRELCQVNEILREASAYFAQTELDSRPR